MEFEEQPSFISHLQGWSFGGFDQKNKITGTRDSSSIGRALQREGILLLNAPDIGSSPIYSTI